MQQQQHHNCCLCNCLTTCYCLPASATACSKPLNTATPLWWRNFGSALLRTPVVGGCLRVRKLLLYSTATVHYADGQSRALQVEVGQRGAGGPGAERGRGARGREGQGGAGLGRGWADGGRAGGGRVFMVLAGVLVDRPGVLRCGGV